MASALVSEEEFHRMQLQLIELRTDSYELDGKCKRLEREVSERDNRIEHLDKELAKANKAISKSKKAKETELLIQENDSFQRKLLSQEEEFRLQNQTLMTELTSLVADNEDLKKQCEELQAGSKKKSVAAQPAPSPETEDQMRHLQAQNAALQKKLSATQDKYEKEVSSLRELLNLKSDSDGEKGRQSPAGSEDVSGDQREVEGQADNDGPTTVNNCVSQSEKKVEELVEKVNDLQLNLDTEGEENRLLKDQLKKSKEQAANIEEEVEKMSEKLKKKQESFLQLQMEKETLFEDSKKKTEELQGARDRDQKYYQDQINKLQQEVEKAKQVQESLKSSSNGHTQDLQRKVTELQKQVDTAGIVGSHQLQEQSSKHQQESKELGAQLGALRQRNDDLTAQLQESQRAGQEAVARAAAAQQALAGESQQLAEVGRVAEKRKALLDQLAIKYQQDSDLHRQQALSTQEEHSAALGDLNHQITALQARVGELSKTQPLLEELQTKLKSLDETKGWLERKLKETEDQLQKSQVDLEESREDLQQHHATELGAVKEEHTAELITMKDAHEQQSKDWEAREGKLQDEVDTLQSAVSALNQTIKDEKHDKKLHEKKGMTMMKDLKRQLHAERKRAEKLQEKLQEVLSESKNRSMEELFRPADPGDIMQCDRSSVSSWSAAASGLGKDSIASGPQSPMTGNNSFNSGTSDPGEESNELLRRLGDIQQEKWALEEKVNHLETSNGCMAEDLLQKTAIIEHYVMNTHSAGGRRQSGPHGSGGGGHGGGSEDKVTLKKVMELLKSSEHGEVHEMNRKLQLMLEETLTKNMHLQQDLETMSQELVRLSKLPVQILDSPDRVTSPCAAPPTPSTISDTTTTTTTAAANPPLPASAAADENQNSVSHGDRPQSLSLAAENGTEGT